MGYIYYLYRDAAIKGKALEIQSQKAAIAEKAAVDALNDLKKETAMNYAKQRVSYGDDYLSRNNISFALASYYEAIDTIRSYDTTEYYIRLKSKTDSLEKIK